MLFLTENEKQEWDQSGKTVLRNRLGPDQCPPMRLEPGMKPMFRFHAGCLLAANGFEKTAKQWFAAGALEENEGMMTNSFTAAFLDRQHDKFAKPATVFQDPAPYIHFGATPAIKSSRDKLVRHSSNSLPRFDAPPAFLDIGCGDGSLTKTLLTAWRAAGIFDEPREILLVDSSRAMLDTAVKTLSGLFPTATINTMHGRIQDVCGQIKTRHEIALSSLAFHHMPMETKIQCLKTLKPVFDHFIVFELDANNDLPELGSPELSASVYQSYGRIINFVFEHDTAVETAQNCVDCFLMTELVSLMTEPRGARNDYHATRHQWRRTFSEALGREFRPRAETTTFSDEFLDLFMAHYRR